MSFAADMARIATKTGGKLEKLGRAVKISTFSGVINDTRVDTGRLRGNFQTSEGLPTNTTTDRLSPSGSESIQEVISTVQPFSLSYMTNNLPYAEVYEEKDAMIARNVQITLNNISRMVSELTR